MTKKLDCGGDSLTKSRSAAVMKIDYLIKVCSFPPRITCVPNCPRHTHIGFSHIFSLSLVFLCLTRAQR
jgi:hypothetical protein